MLKKTTKRFISIVMAALMIVSMIPFTAFADETTASDLSGHWAENVITEWMDYGIINGYEDGTIRPNNKITRAEMTAMLDRVMDYQTKANNTFSDLSDSWYTDVILKANAAGVISGYPDGTVKPDATITRQEAVAMFSRVLSLDTKNAPEATFTDNADVADWAKDAVNAMAAADYIHGSDGQFRPNDGITRAEVVTILNNIFDKLYQKAGEYTGDVDGSAVINTDQVTLKDMTISGDLIIAEGVGDGHVVLDNVTVDGKLIVRGGGENSVIIKGDSKIDNISVERIDGAVRVAVEGNASVNAVLIDNGGQDVKLEGTIDTVNVASANVNVDITGAAKDINVADTATNATITVTSTATADNVSTSAENTTIIVAGAVSNIDIADTANNSVVTTQSSATVDKVTTAAGSTTVEGSGTVTDVVVGENASDATVTTEGTKVENNSSSNVTTGDDSVIAPGTTDTTPGGTTETPSVPSTPSGPSHTHNYVDGVCAADGAIDPSWAQVNSTATWNEAVAAGKNIVVTADFTTDAQLQITKAITVNGNGHTITAGTWTDTNTSSKGDANLVSINAGDNAVVIKNITLAEAKTINNDENNKDYASGLNVYKSSNVTLDKVTLKDNDAAGMIVNSSNVKATGLVTSGNSWGGVNVDNGADVEADTIFTFDATSTFNETAKVYSDNGSVTVNAPEGWACAQVSGKYIWAKLFEGGNGSEEKPYLISTAEQLAAVFNYAGHDEDHAANEFFKVADGITEIAAADVLSNIDPTLKKEYFGGYTGYACYASDFSGTLDGNNITLSNLKLGDGYFALLYQMNGGTIRNLKITLDSSKDSMLCATMNSNATMENISISADSTIQTGNNYAPFVYEAFNSTLKDCNNYVDINGTYFAAFVGYWAQNTTFNNCNNWGNLTGTYVGVLIANQPSDMNNGLSISDCNNYGTLYGSNKVGFMTGNPRNHADNDTFNTQYSKNLTSTIEVNGITYTGQAISPVTLQDFAINANGQITQTTESDKGVSYYKAVYTGYAKNSIEGGTLFINIYSEQLNHTGSETLNSNFATGCKMIDYASAAENVKTACDGHWIDNKTGDPNYDKYAIVTVDGTTYCVINFKNTALTINTTATLVARAYDVNGNMLTQVSAS